MCVRLMVLVSMYGIYTTVVVAQNYVVVVVVVYHITTYRSFTCGASSSSRTYILLL